MSAQGRDAPRSVRDYLELTEGFLAGKQVDSARLDAQVLLAEAVSMARLELLTQFDRPLAADEVSRYRELVRRRALREPVSYILGRREFWSLDFVVDRRVLIHDRKASFWSSRAPVSCAGSSRRERDCVRPMWERDRELWRYRWPRKFHSCR